MLGDPKFVCEMGQILDWIGGVAIRSSGACYTELCDLSEWLNERTHKRIKNPNDLPEAPIKRMLMVLWETRNFIEWDSVFPLARELTTQSTESRIELADLIITTTLVTPIIKGVWERNKRDLGAKEGDVLDTETLTQMVIFSNENCVLTIDAKLGGLIKSLTHIATKLNVFWERPKRRKLTRGASGALDPTIRVIGPNFNFVRSTDLLETVRKDPNPLTGIADQLTLLRCAHLTPNGPGHSTLGVALEVLLKIFFNGEFAVRSYIVDNYDVI